MSTSLNEYPLIAPKPPKEDPSAEVNYPKELDFTGCFTHTPRYWDECYPANQQGSVLLPGFEFDESYPDEDSQCMDDFDEVLVDDGLPFDGLDEVERVIAFSKYTRFLLCIQKYLEDGKWSVCKKTLYAMYPPFSTRTPADVRKVMHSSGYTEFWPESIRVELSL